MNNSSYSQKDILSVNTLVLNFKMKVGKPIMCFREILDDQNWNRNKHISLVKLDRKHLHHSIQLLKRHTIKMATNQALQEEANTIHIVHF